MIKKIIYEGAYIALWNNGDFVVTDGVGYVGAEDTREVYEALKKYFEGADITSDKMKI